MWGMYQGNIYDPGSVTSLTLEVGFPHVTLEKMSSPRDIFLILIAIYTLVLVEFIPSVTVADTIELDGKTYPYLIKARALMAPF